MLPHQKSPKSSLPVCLILLLRRHPLGLRHVRESHSLLSLQAPNKVRPAYEIFLPPVQKLVRAYIQLPGRPGNALSALFSQSLVRDHS